MSRSLDRWSPVTLRGKLRVPAGTLRMFEAAATLGRVMRHDGTFADLAPGRKPRGVEVGAVHRKRVSDACGIDEKTWQNVVPAWVERRMAHRCRRNVVFLFVEPLDGAAATCPGCSATLAEVPVARTPIPGSRDSKSSQPGLDRAYSGGCNGDEGGDGRVLSPSEPLESLEGLDLERAAKILNDPLLTTEEALENIRRAFPDAEEVS